ncbi:phage integrase SAM-like domain-containing protein [Hyphobacterium sp. CCMP332]|nr:phage integrase SAM-like domain-containing protein [Hyphobacterium sp. CCMP332]
MIVRLRPTFKIKNTGHTQLRTHYNKKMVQIAIGHISEPDSWNSKGDPLEGKKVKPGDRKLFDQWRKNLQKVEDFFNQQKIDPTSHEIKLALENVKYNRELSSRTTAMTFIDFLDDWFSNDFKHQHPKGNTFIRYSSGAMHNKGQFYKVIKKYNEEIHRISFSTIDLKFYHDFVTFLKNTQTESGKKGYGINTIGKYIKELKFFLREAESEGHIVNPAYKNKKFMVIQEESNEDESIALTPLEILKLADFPLPIIEKENSLSEKPKTVYRDWFVLGCCLGLRVGDLLKLQKSDIIKENGFRFIHVRTGKTGREVWIPIQGLAEEILEKYNNNFPPNITEQKLNKHIKEIGKAAGLDRWRHLKTHVMRRTMITNAYLDMVREGIDRTTELMEISGHTTISNFIRYIKISHESHKRNFKPLKINVKQNYRDLLSLNKSENVL